ncbi:MAG: hypothetical protein K0R26_204 [Bacteroidota bacterium]|jgi:hypothetical protein|nr:hypothetical protein [Bacteroidota bacterium]
MECKTKYYLVDAAKSRKEAVNLQEADHQQII